MNDRTAGALLLVIGVVALFAAIVGGGIKIQQIEVGSVQSKWRQWLLAVFGLVIGVIGLAMVIPDSDTPNKTADADNVAATDVNDVTATDANGAESNPVDTSAAEANASGGADAQSNSADENASQ